MSKRKIPSSKSSPAIHNQRPKADATSSKRTKLDGMLVLMRRMTGASLKALQSSTGWQAHSVRGALSGLRKKGVPVTLVKHSGKTSTYHAPADK